MNSEQKKEYLKSYRQAVIAVRQLQDEIDQLRLDKMSPPAVEYSDMPKVGGRQDMSNYMVMLEELEDSLYTAKYKRIQLYTNIHKCIEAMEDETERNLLRAKYIHLKTWEQVGEIMGYDERQARRIHEKAICSVTCPVMSASGHDIL